MGTLAHHIWMHAAALRGTQRLVQLSNLKIQIGKREGRQRERNECFISVWSARKGGREERCSNSMPLLWRASFCMGLWCSLALLFHSHFPQIQEEVLLQHLLQAPSSCFLIDCAGSSYISTKYGKISHLRDKCQHCCISLYGLKEGV